jgi:hypothetical protein
MVLAGQAPNRIGRNAVLEIKRRIDHTGNDDDPNLVNAVGLLLVMAVLFSEGTQAQPEPHAAHRDRASRRARGAMDLALRLLSPVDRQRYREEWSAELADLPRRDQAPYAFRLLSRALILRRELSGKPARNPRSVLFIVGAVIPGTDAVAALCGLDWPAAVVGISWTAGLLWVISSNERTRRLIALIQEGRSGKVPTRK